MDEAEQLYAAYPRKRARRAALKAINSALKRAPFDAIMAGLRRHSLEMAKREAKFIPYPATWFNGDCWEDDADKVAMTPEEARRRIAEQDRKIAEQNARYADSSERL